MAGAEAYLHAKFHLDPSNRLATVHQRHRHDTQTGQWSSRIGRTVLQTVAQELRATGNLPDSGIGYVSGVWDPEDFTE